MIGTGIGPSSPAPAVWTICGMPGIGAPSESISASPRAAFSVASVGMNACGIRPLTSITPFNSADRRAGEQHHRDHQDAAEVAPAVGQGAGDGAQREQRADREVDPADEDHEQLADRQARERRDLDGDVGQVVAGQEERRGEGHDHGQHDEDERGPEADDPQRGVEAPLGESRRAQSAAAVDMSPIPYPDARAASRRRRVDQCRSRGRHQAPARGGRDDDRRDLRPARRRQGRQPGGRGRAARRAR